MTEHGGLTYLDEQAWISRERLERDHEPHTMAKLPCCGSAVEIKDPSVDNYVTCPNVNCRKHHVVLSGLKHELRSETSNEPAQRLVW